MMKITETTDTDQRQKDSITVANVKESRIHASRPVKQGLLKSHSPSICIHETAREQILITYVFRIFIEICRHFRVSNKIGQYQWTLISRRTVLLIPSRK
jgi:hypothetical protein